LETSGEPDQGNLEEFNLTYSDTASSRRLSEETHSIQARLAPGKSQPKSNTAHATSELEISSETANNNPHFPKTLHSDITTSPHSTEEIQLDQATAQENWLTPSFTPDTRILILESYKASWIQIEDVKSGDTAIQFLPSRCLDDVCGAQLATIERVWMFERGDNDVDIVQFGEAYITANHPIHTADGWMMASQAVARGHGTVLSDNVYSKFYNLQLVTGGNIIINTSTSTDLPFTHTESATMGYRFLPPSNLLNRNFPTYPQQETTPRDRLAAQAKPSYSQVTQLRLQQLLSWPNPQLTPSGSETNTSPELDVQSIEDTTNTTRHATPLATCLHIHSAIVPDPQPKGIGIPETYQDILSKFQQGRGCQSTTYNGDPTHTEGFVVTPHNSWKLYRAIITLRPAISRLSSSTWSTLTPARSSIKLPLQESRVLLRDRHGHWVKKNLRKGSWERTGITTKWNRLGQVGVRGTGGTGTGGTPYWVEQDGTGTGKSSD